MSKLQISVFLIEPIGTDYKKIIVYSDNCESARKAAADKFDTLYLDKNLSACTPVDQKNIIEVDEKNNWVKLEYGEVKYELFKDKPELLTQGGIPSL